jgi:hypothetical protein
MCRSHTGQYGSSSTRGRKCSSSHEIPHRHILRRGLYTHSPSEPALVLGAVDILYETPGRWAPILNTFGTTLCDSGVVEKGLIGKLGARMLLLVARDFSAPKSSNKVPDVLQLVPLMYFFDTLFGNTTWCSGNRKDCRGIPV